MSQEKDFVSTYTDWASSFTHAPEIFHHFIAYWCVSAVLRNKVWNKQGLFNVYPNLWMILIAKSSWFGKSTAIRIGRDIIEKTIPDLFYPDEFSYENIIKNLSNKPQGNFVFSEFRTLMKMMDKDYMSGTKSLFTELFDNPTRRTRRIGTKVEIEYTIENPVINIVAATTIDWFTDTVKDKDILSGFIPRFIFVPAKKLDKIYPRQKIPDQSVENDLVSMLSHISNKQGGCNFSSSAGLLYDELTTKFFNRHYMNGNLCSPFYPRLITYALKFSILNSCVNDNFPMISETDVEMAWDTIKRLTSAINEIIENEVTFTQDQLNKKRILDHLKSKYPEKLSWSELLKYSKLRRSDLSEATESLVQTGEITKEDAKPEGGAAGRPRTLFQYSPQKVELDDESNN